MIEILQILIIFFIFSLMCFMPFNVLDSKILVGYLPPFVVRDRKNNTVGRPKSLPGG